MKVLLTGATGYVGGRLRAELERRGVPLRCFARRAGALRERVAPATEIEEGDALDVAAVARAMQGVDAAYYLIHSMAGGDDFARRDREAARVFGSAAREAGVRRIIYLGGLGDNATGLSEHLRSRQETGDILRESGVAVVELRASIVLGSGSLSFEMVRALVERLPVMICPRWVAVETQPIAIGDVIAYLVGALDIPAGEERIYEIGGPDQVSYGELMREYARQRGLKRLLIPVPLLTPRLSSLWLGLVTPLYARVGRKLIDSLRNRTVIRDRSALSAFPVRPRGVREAIAAALIYEEESYARTRWSDAVSSSGLRDKPYGGELVGSRFVDTRAVAVSAAPPAAFSAVTRIGGANGWYYGEWLWKLRGFLDLLAGGVGMRRGRPRPDDMSEGDALDFWRVEKIEPGRLLRLRAEMNVPGRAWLQFEVTPAGSGSEIRQTAIFNASGLAGLVYWYALYPIHRFVFRGMLRGIASRAEGGEVRPAAFSRTGSGKRGGGGARSARRRRGMLHNSSTDDAIQNEWTDAIERHRTAIAEYVQTASLIAEQGWRLPVETEKWTPAQITDHLIRTYQISLAQIRGGQGMKMQYGFLLRQILRLAVLPRIFRTRRLPGGAKAPSEILPADSKMPRETTLEQLEELAGEFERQILSRRHDENLRLTHHVFGKIKPLKGVDFIAIHIEHHGRQLPRN